MPTLSGTVLDSVGNPVQKLVRAYARNTGALAGWGYSDPGTGAWSISTTTTEEHFVVVFDAIGNSNYANMVAGFHFNGANGSTVFSEVTGKTVTVAGGAQISTAQSRFGGSSGAFLATGDYVVASGLSSVDMTRDFGVGFWYYPTSVSSGQRALVHMNAGGNGGLHIHADNATLVVDNGLAGTTASGSVFTAGQWHYIEVDRVGTTLTAYVGTIGGTASAVLSHTAQSYTTPTQLQLGRFSTGGIIPGGNGYIDDFQCYVGNWLHNAGGFAVPTSPFLDALSGGTENGLFFDRVVPV